MDDNGQTVKLLAHRPGADAGSAHAMLNTDWRAATLAARIAGTIQQQTGGGIMELEVEVSREGVLLKGRCETFYSKQLAQHAAMSIATDKPLINSIQVADSTWGC